MFLTKVRLICVLYVYVNLKKKRCIGCVLDNFVFFFVCFVLISLALSYYPSIDRFICRLLVHCMVVAGFVDSVFHRHRPFALQYLLLLQLSFHCTTSQCNTKCKRFRLQIWVANKNIIDVVFSSLDSFYRFHYLLHQIFIEFVYSVIAPNHILMWLTLCFRIIPPFCSYISTVWKIADGFCANKTCNFVWLISGFSLLFVSHINCVKGYNKKTSAHRQCSATFRSNLRDEL